MAEPVLEEDVNLEEKLAPCGICGRTFLPKPLAKHEIVCEKNATKKRKIFNSLKQRVEGTDLAQFHQRSYLKKPEIVEEIPKSAWKEKHQQLVNAIRAAKSAPQRIDHIHTKRIPVTSSGCERCPTCDRQFGPKAFDRHVEWCKERKARLPQSPANIMQAKERLEARIKYRVPPLSKPKRSVKEKYQSPYRNENIPVSRSTGNLDRKPSIRRDGGSTLNLKPAKPEARSPEARSETPKAKVEAAKSCGRRATTKLNTTDVNTISNGLTVSQLNGPQPFPKKLVTWSDTFANPVSPKLQQARKKIVLRRPLKKPKKVDEDKNIWNNSSGLIIAECCKPETPPTPPEVCAIKQVFVFNHNISTREIPQNLNVEDGSARQRTFSASSDDNISFDSVEMPKRGNWGDSCKITDFVELDLPILTNQEAGDQNPNSVPTNIEDDVCKDEARTKSLVFLKCPLSNSECASSASSIKCNISNKSFIEPDTNEEIVELVEPVVNSSNEDKSSWKEWKSSSFISPSEEAVENIVDDDSGIPLEALVLKKGYPNEYQLFRINESREEFLIFLKPSDQSQILGQVPVDDNCILLVPDYNKSIACNHNKMSDQSLNTQASDGKIQYFHATEEPRFEPKQSDVFVFKATIADSLSDQLKTKSDIKDIEDETLSNEIIDDDECSSSGNYLQENSSIENLERFEKLLSAHCCDEVNCTTEFNKIYQNQNSCEVSLQADEKDFASPSERVKRIIMPDCRIPSDSSVKSKFFEDFQKYGVVLNENNESVCEIIDKDTPNCDEEIPRDKWKCSDSEIKAPNLESESCECEIANLIDLEDDGNPCKDNPNKQFDAHVPENDSLKQIELFYGSEEDDSNFFCYKPVKSEQQNTILLNKLNMDVFTFGSQFIEELKSNSKGDDVFKFEVTLLCRDNNADFDSFTGGDSLDTPKDSLDKSSDESKYAESFAPSLDCTENIEDSTEMALRKKMVLRLRDNLKSELKVEEVSPQDAPTSGLEVVREESKEIESSKGENQLKGKESIRDMGSMDLIPTKLNQVSCNSFITTSDEETTVETSSKFSFDKLNSQNIEKMIFKKSDDCNSLEEVESLQGFCDWHSMALSKARLERELRTCCSEIALSKRSSEFSVGTRSETNLVKNVASCYKSENEFKNEEFDAAKILEIAGIEFIREISTPKENSSIGTSNPRFENLSKRPGSVDSDVSVEISESKKMKMDWQNTKNDGGLKLPQIEVDVKKGRSAKEPESLVLPKIDNNGKTNRQETYDPYKTAHKQFLELLDEDQDTITPTLVVTKKKNPTKRASVIDPPCDFRDNFELIENFINKNLNDENLLKKLDFDSISLSSNKTTFSETTLYEIDPRLINEFDNLSIPDILPTDENSPSPPKKSLVPRKTKTPNLNRSSSIRSASPRDRIKNLNTLKKSITVLDTVKPKNLKNKEDVQNYLHEREISRSPKKKPDVVPVPAADDLFSIDDEMYEEYKRYEQMYLQEKEEKMRKEQKMHSAEEAISKISGDSAYGSLSRNKPKVRTKVAKLSPLEHESQTSSGSEVCISARTIASAMKHPQTNFSSNKDTGGCCSGKMTKFCHECGNKYPVTTAKFCVECGVRRLVL